MTKPEQDWPPEPYAITRNSGRDWVDDAEGKQVSLFGEPLRRMVACTNAAAGIPDPAEWRAAVAEVKQKAHAAWHALEAARHGNLTEALAAEVSDALDAALTRLSAAEGEG